MCGICGIVSTNSKESYTRDKVVQLMNKHLIHRGPDDEGFASFDNCSMAMRRLSIIDVQGGKQPIYNEDRSVALFFNGEIYNFQQLKKELGLKGHRFRTSSDSEVIVHLYEEYGLHLAEYLQGMFAFSLFDKTTNRVVLGRDPFGEKPLYYHEGDGNISYSSELTSLIQNTDIPRVLNITALKYYLKTGIVPEPLTMFKDIYSLPPGHLMTINEYGLSLRKYFNPQFHQDNAFKNEAEAIDSLEPLFQQAVSRQMISDVPIGAFLSGGIDSSSVVAMMQKHSSSRIKTFTVQFENVKYDESKIAKEVAQHLCTDHYQISIPNEDFSESLFWKLLDHFGVPFSDSSCIPTFLVTQEIAKHVKVALSGDGGDEIFGGYKIFQWWKQVNSLRKLPISIRKLISYSASTLSTESGLLKNSSLLRQLNKAVDLSYHQHRHVPLVMHQMFSDNEVLRLCGKSGSNGFSYPIYQEYFDDNLGLSDIRQMMNYRLRYNLPSNMLIKVDRMSMANSLEVRAPFLDSNLFEASLRLPGNMMVNGGKGKYIIRKMMRKYLPASVFNHPKQGFAIPLHTYQNIEYQILASKLFSKENPLSELISLTYVKEIQEEALQHSHKNSKISTYRSSQRLWALMMLFGWMNYFNVELPD